FDGVVKARDRRSDRLVHLLKEGLEVRHLASEPLIDAGMVRRWLGRLSAGVPLDLFRHGVSSSVEGMAQGRPGCPTADPACARPTGLAYSEEGTERVEPTLVISGAVASGA